MMLKGKKSSESNSNRCTFGDEGGAEGGDWVRFSGFGGEVARVLI